MVINFRKLNRQVLPFKPETKQGFIFIATNEQKENGLFSIAKVGSKRSMNSIIEAAFWAGFEPSSDDLTEAALYEEAKVYLEKSIQY